MAVRKWHGAGDTIAIIGLGYVGYSLALEFAGKTQVIGFDTSSARIEKYKQEQDTAEKTAESSLQIPAMTLTSDPRLLREADVFIIAVPTPVHEDNTVDLECVRKASITVGTCMSAGSLIVYESTVYPGVTENICIPLLEEYSGMKAGVDFFVGYSPERICPGDQIHTLLQVNKIISGQDEETLEDMARVYGLIFDDTVPGCLYRAESIRVAEAAKVVENAQRDVNIAFMNEIAFIMHSLGIDTVKVLNAMKTKWNHLPFRPGLVGGHCISVDPYYLIQEAQRHNYSADFLLAARRINEEIPSLVAGETIREFVRAGENPAVQRICVMGLTYKENVNDLRNSKVYPLVQALGKYGISPYLVDPVADPDEVESIYGRRPTDLSLVKNADCLIVCVAHRFLADWSDREIMNRLRPGGLLVDVCGAFSRTRLENLGCRYWSL